MKKFRFITALVLVLGLVLCMPFAAQAEEEEFREVYLDAAYKLSDTQIVFDFSEPIMVNQKQPFIDIRMTNASGVIVGQYDDAGNRVSYYQWTAKIDYFNADHDKILLTMTGDRFGCDSFSDLLGGKGTFDENPVKDADIKSKIEKGTYVFLASMEELYLVSPNEALNDGMLKNFCSEADNNVFVWPTRLSYGECVGAFLNELKPMPAGLVYDETKVEGLGGKGQQWDFDIMELGEPLEETDTEEVMTTTVVQNDPMVVALILGAGVVVAAVLIVVFVLASKKRKAA